MSWARWWLPTLADLPPSPSSEEHLEAQADRPDNFVPIQIDLDVDTFKIRDAFVWNANGEAPEPSLRSDDG